MIQKTSDMRANALTLCFAVKSNKLSSITSTVTKLTCFVTGAIDVISTSTTPFGATNGTSEIVSLERATLHRGTFN